MSLTKPEPVGERETGSEPVFESGPASSDSNIGREPSFDADGGQPSTNEQLRQSVRVPAVQDHPLPRTKDALVDARELCSLMFAGSLALVAGLRTRAEVRK